MKNLLKQFAGALIILSIIVGAGLGAHHAYAVLRFVETPTITLYSSISGSATSMRVTPYPKDLDGNKLTMNDFGSSTTATIDPKIRNVEEIVGFTGITDNGDGTATLTGLTRDLTAKYPYTTTGTGRAHSASAIVVFSNNPQMYNRLAAKENNESIGGNWTFGGNNIFTGTTTLLADCNSLSLNTQLCAKAYIDARASAGAANANDSTAGLVEMATAAEAAAGTNLGSTGARLALGANLSTSTCQVVQGSVIAASSTTGKIDKGCIDQTASYSFSGTTTLATSTTIGSGAAGGLMPPGSITAYASTTAPAGWLLVNGASVLRASYPGLYAVLGCSYTCVDGTHFTLPDLRGRNILMASSTANIGQTGGESNHTQTLAELAPHVHSIATGNGGGADADHVEVSSTASNQSTSASAIASAGGGAPMNVLDPYIALFYIIKY